MRRTLRTHLLSSWAWLQEEKERAVHDEDQPSYFWRAHTGTVLIVLLCVLVYIALVGKGRGPYRPKGILLLSVSIVLSIQMHFCLYLDLRIRARSGFIPLLNFMFFIPTLRKKYLATLCRVTKRPKQKFKTIHKPPVLSLLCSQSCLERGKNRRLRLQLSIFNHLFCQLNVINYGIS